MGVERKDLTIFILVDIAIIKDEVIHKFKVIGRGLIRPSPSQHTEHVK